MLTVGGYGFGPRDTSLSDVHSATRIFASALCSSVAVTGIGLSAHGILHGESEPAVHEPTVSNGIDRVTVHELLHARVRERPIRVTLPLILHCCHRLQVISTVCSTERC